MELRSANFRRWGIFAWTIVFSAVVIAGLPDALMRSWMHRVTEPSPRSGTDSMLFRNLGLHDGTAKLRSLLANSAPPTKFARTYVVRVSSDKELEEVAIAIAVLAWPDDVRFVNFDKGEFVPRVPANSDAPARVFYLGRRPRETVPGLQAIGERLWFKSGKAAP